jgi:hypothetical protein
LVPEAPWLSAQSSCGLIMLSPSQEKGVEHREEVKKFDSGIHQKL